MIAYHKINETKKKYQKIGFIYNPFSNKGKSRDYFEKNIILNISKWLDGRDVLLRQTYGKGDATIIAKNMIEMGYELIVACGGDGTINEVLNGIVDVEQMIAKAALAVIPIGTGNDFASSLGWSVEDNSIYEKIINAIAEGRTINIDIGEVKNKDNKRFWINSCGVGLSGEIINGINNSTTNWIPKDWVYKLQTLYQNLIYTNKNIKYTSDNNKSFNVKSQALIVSNGKFFGGGMCGSPKAEINDGLLNYGILGDVGIIDMLSILPSIYEGKHTNHPKVKVDVCKKLICEPVEDSDKVRIETDGELFGYAPCTIQIHSNILPIIIN
ncbi:diacylglycerol kinase catalytic domain protein [Catovirus CTV1]|uniref:Diacylglycerol kinase catalytic domain protein n=1 Tax=Catovirus CTV1 TaxID=1977631 RepID=A0A1V0SBJ0_9VIRU|nr:diacylglycerol kinase catalytic domain protein [Catovirus CTV1]